MLNSNFYVILLCMLTCIIQPACTTSLNLIIITDNVVTGVKAAHLTLTISQLKMQAGRTTGCNF